MKQIIFHVNLCKINSAFALSTMVNTGIKCGNVFTRQMYTCLCDVLSIEDDTTENDWLNPDNVVKKTTFLLIDTYVNFLDLLEDVIKVPSCIEESAELFLSTLEFAKAIYVCNDFIDDEIITKLKVILSKTNDSQIKEILSPIVGNLKFEKMKMQGGVFVVMNNKIYDA